MLTRRRFLADTLAGPVVLSPRTMQPAWGETAPLLIDSHVHVFEQSPAFPFAAGARPPAEDASPAMLLELMRLNGVARTVIIQVSHYLWDNSYLANVLKRYANNSWVCAA